MPRVGDEEFDYTPEGWHQAEQRAAETGIPMTKTVTEHPELMPERKSSPDGKATKGKTRIMRDYS